MYTSVKHVEHTEDEMNKNMRIKGNRTTNIILMSESIFHGIMNYININRIQLRQRKKPYLSQSNMPKRTRMGNFKAVSQ